MLLVSSMRVLKQCELDVKTDIFTTMVSLHVSTDDGGVFHLDCWRALFKKYDSLQPFGEDRLGFDLYAFLPR